MKFKNVELNKSNEYRDLSTKMSNYYSNLTSSDLVYKSNVLFTNYYDQLCELFDIDTDDLYNVYKAFIYINYDNKYISNISFKSLIRDIHNKSTGDNKNPLVNKGVIFVSIEDLDEVFNSFFKRVNDEISIYDFHIPLETFFYDYLTYGHRGNEEGKLELIPELDFIKFKIMINERYDFNLGEDELYSFTYKNYVRENVVKHFDCSI